MWLAAASPALAQTCEGGAKGKAGEVFVAAAPSGEVATWILERVEGEGMESDHFARPGLMLDFRFARGALSGPDKVVVSITRFSDPDVGRAPELSAVWIEAQLDGRSLGWLGSDQAKGERALAQALSAAWPNRLVIELHAGASAAGRKLAAAEFDLSVRGAAEVLAREALAGRACQSG